MNRIGVRVRIGGDGRGRIRAKGEIMVAGLATLTHTAQQPPPSTT